jgi:arylsulfatase A-like enzyme
MTQTQPNIILINCDDLGYGDLGCYGSPKNKTPHLDALAAGGLRLTDFYMASPVCSASRAGMLTGCYPPRIGFGDHSVLFPGQDAGLHPDEETLGGLLRRAGYDTKIVGKWHCGDQPEFLPTSHGFDEYFGIPFSNDMGRQSNNPDRPPLPLVRDQTVIQEQPDQRGITERYTDEALQFINQERDRPFFLYLAHMYVHVPLFVPQQFLDESENGAYGGAVQCIDWSTGMIVDWLRQHGQLDNTLVIFTSDNGSRARDEGGSNQPCRGTKATTWEGGQRVPCIMHWPAAISPGRTYRHVTRSIDLFPTLAAIAGVEVSDERALDGVDLSPVVTGRHEDSVNDTFFYYRGNALEAVRVGDWKLHVHKGSEPLQALFNLRDDVGETENRYEAEPEVVERLTARLEDMRGELGDALTDAPGRARRASGRVHDAKPLTEYREDHPYMIALYDLPDMPTLSG